MKMYLIINEGYDKNPISLWWSTEHISTSKANEIPREAQFSFEAIYPICYVSVSSYLGVPRSGYKDPFICFIVIWYIIYVSLCAFQRPQRKIILRRLRACLSLLVGTPVVLSHTLHMTAKGKGSLYTIQHMPFYTQLEWSSTTLWMCNFTMHLPPATLCVVGSCCVFVIRRVSFVCGSSYPCPVWLGKRKYYKITVWYLPRALRVNLYETKHRWGCAKEAIRASGFALCQTMRVFVHSISLRIWDFCKFVYYIWSGNRPVLSFCREELFAERTRTKKMCVYTLLWLRGHVGNCVPAVEILLLK